MKKKRIVVSGIGVVCAIGSTNDEFRDALLAGASGQREINHFQAGAYRSSRAGVVEQALALLVDEPDLDRCLRFALHAGAQALADAGNPHLSGSADRIGVAVASSLGCVDSLQAFIGEHIAGRQPHLAAVNQVPHCVPAQELARRHGLGGAVLTVDTACASGTNAIGLACDQIRRGDCDIMLAGGVDVLSPLSYSGFSGMMNLSKTRCQPFDQNRSGIMLGEGAAIMVLESLESALARGSHVYGEIYGYGLANDAYHETKPDPQASGAVAAMRMALAEAGIAACDIEYVNAHGTGTKFNDAMEITAIREVFGEHAPRLAISSIKAAIGHTLGAAGAIEFHATVLNLEHGFLSPTIHLENPMEEARDLDFVPNAARQARVKIAMSNSFGFAGNCSSIIYGVLRDSATEVQP